MGDSFRPAHFGDVYQTLYAGFQLDERAVRCQVDHFAFDAGADRIFFLDARPRIFAHLLEAQGNLFFFLIEIQNFHFDFLIHVNHFRRMRDAVPAHIGNMQQAVHTAQIDEHAEVCDVLYDTFANLSDFKIREQLVLRFCTFFFDEFSTGNDDIPSGNINFDDLGFNRLTDVFADIARPPNIDLACGQEHRHPDIYKQTRLDLSADTAGYLVAFMACLDNTLPALDAVGFAF